jgi:hypothetical protein
VGSELPRNWKSSKGLAEEPARVSSEPQSNISEANLAAEDSEGEGAVGGRESEVVVWSMKSTKSLSLCWKSVVNGGWQAGADVVNHSNLPPSVVSLSEPTDVTTPGRGRSTSEEVMIGLEGGGEDDSNFGSANRPRGCDVTSGSSTSLLGFGNESVKPPSSSSCSKSITTLLVTEEDDDDLKMGGDLCPLRKGLIVLKRLGSFFGVIPSVVPSGVNSGDSEAARRALRLVGVRLREPLLLRLVGVFNTKSLDREASGLELKIAGEEEATSGRSTSGHPVPDLFFFGVTGLLLAFLSPRPEPFSSALTFVCPCFCFPREFPDDDNRSIFSSSATICSNFLFLAAADLAFLFVFICVIFSASAASNFAAVSSESRGTVEVWVLAQAGTTNLFFPSAFAVGGVVEDSEAGSDSTELVFLIRAVAQLDLPKDEDDEWIGGFISQSLSADDVDPCEDEGGSGSKVGSE